jgi:plasmid stabilization system protein ParE
MAEVVFSSESLRDAREITTYLEDIAGSAVAEKYSAEFKAVFRNLAHFPASGPRRSKLGPFTRIKIVLPYLIIYDHEGDTVTVLRIVHGQRNITRKLIKR